MKPTLRQIKVANKRIDRMIAIQKGLTKEGFPNPYLVALKEQKEQIKKSVAQLTDPKNCLRSALPKKQQRKLGLLPKV